jgi:hypothetical protein
MNTNDYKAVTGELLGDAQNALAKASELGITTALLAIGNRTGDEDRASMAVKLTLSTIGMARSLLQNGIRSDTKEEFSEKGDHKISRSSPVLDRYDSDRDFCFRCGDYYMPLSIRFTLRAQKNFAESQLIDGPHIIERVSKAPKTIDVTIRLERKGAYEIRTGDQAAFERIASQGPQNLYIVNTEDLYNPVPDISAMVNDLYERQDVFVLENPVLNGEHGVTHVVMRDYTIIPGEGTTLMTLQMSLMQVDINANIINNEGNDAGNGSIYNDNPTPIPPNLA